MQRSLGWVLLALGAIWISVAIISVSATDLIFGADETTFPIVPLVTWLWGVFASAYVLSAFVQRRRSGDDQRHAWVGISVATTIIWGVVTILALVIPDFTFDLLDDPIIVPLGALLTPAAGVVATGVACQYVPSLTDVAYSEQ